MASPRVPCCGIPYAIRPEAVETSTGRIGFPVTVRTDGRRLGRGCIRECDSFTRRVDPNATTVNTLSIRRGL